MAKQTWFSTKLLAPIVIAFLVVPVAAGLISTPRTTDVVDPVLLQKLRAEPTAVFDALATFEGDVDGARIQELKGLGLQVPRVFDAFGIVYVVGTGADLLRLAGSPGVLSLVGNDELEYYGDTATVATRAREVWDSSSSSTNPVTVGGNVVDGSGVGIAILDTGFDGTHPDLAGVFAVNQKWECTTPFLISTSSQTCFGNFVLGATGCTEQLWIDAVHTDLTSGHGTHVAGIAAGRGVASDGRFMGAAPGATLYGLGIGDVISVLSALEGLNWIKCNHAANGIRVVSASWGLNAVYNPANPINVAVNSLVSGGVVVVFAAGNDGGTGAMDTVNTFARNPTQGVLSVANYNDLNRASRTGALDPTSSRCLVSGGVVANAANCPDVSAPGTSIVSSVSKTNVLAPFIFPLLSYMPYYGIATGTSMATPHVAGIVALLLEANPALTPADVEDILEDTALQFAAPGGYGSADPSNPTNGINFAAGHGLVDAVAALQDARVLNATGLGSPLPQTSKSPHVYLGGVADGEVAAGVPGTVHGQWLYPIGTPTQLSERSLVSGGAAYPLTLGLPARFHIVGPVGTVDVGTSITTDGANRQVSALYTFLVSGVYTIEPQIDWGSGYTAIDSFVVHIVP